jgi:preprotein translocase subunit SecA
MRSGRLAEAVEAHLAESLKTLQADWGRTMWTRHAESEFAVLPPEFQSAVREGLVAGGDLPVPEGLVLKDWPAEAQSAASLAMGKRVFTQAYREVLLGVLGQMWVEYLTSMEALRTSIGLEAYAQRDPLVQYKSKAYDLFQTLMQQVRAGVISRIYRMSLRTATQAAATAPAAETPAPEAPSPEQSAAKRKRHRH